MLTFLTVSQAVEEAVISRMGEVNKLGAGVSALEATKSRLEGQLTEAKDALIIANRSVRAPAHLPALPSDLYRLAHPVPLQTLVAQDNERIADEERSGTLETLLTAPVRTWQVVLSKYIAAMVFYSLLWIPAYLQFKAFSWFTDIPPAYSEGALLGSFAILFLMGAAFTAIGCLASALTSSQNFSRMTPDSTMAFSTMGAAFRKVRAWSSLQKPITRSTPARLYQLRSKMTTSPAAGRWPK
jgi:hypothetical protein